MYTLLFNRLVNSEVYVLPSVCFQYLLALQLSIMWIDEDPGEWGDAEDACMDFVNTSCRPCYKFTPLHVHNNYVQNISIDYEKVFRLLLFWLFYNIVFLD